MAAGYSANPLFRKLGLKEGFHIRLIHPPGHYPSWIPEIFDHLIVHKGTGTELDFIHYFPKSSIELEEILPRIKKEIKKNGMIWVSWIKKTSGKISGISENMIRDTALSNGLVDVKVCAMDEDWSGLKLVIPLKDR